MKYFRVILSACALVNLPLPSLVLAQALAQVEDGPVEEVQVVGQRLPPPVADKVYQRLEMDRADLDQPVRGRLDDLLKSIPAFALFRRASSLSAHPTVQGPSIRAPGTNGAARALVLLDGIPINDPFGGWVYWSVLPTDDLESISIFPAGGAGRWGSGALSGTISLTSRAPETGARGRIGTSSFGTINALAAMGFAGEEGSLQLFGQAFDSGGYFLLPSDQRGVVDIRGASDAYSARVRGSRQLSENMVFSFSGAYFEESRVNGLEFSTNNTVGWDLSAVLSHDGQEGPDWQIQAYWSSRTFINSFASVDDLRETSRQVLSQFDVPGEGYGFSGMIRDRIQNVELEVGADLRRLSGATNENYRNLGAGFTRLRVAGGDELIAGAYVEASGQATPALLLSASLRVDYWRNFNGVRVESDLADGSITRQDVIANRDGTVLNGRVGFSYEPDHGGTTLRGAVFSGFRQPTLNELFRPFRVRNDITEANPNLIPERLYGGDLEWSTDWGPAKVSATYYRYWTLNAVANVTIALGPGVFPPTGFVPAGGSLRERQNLGRVLTDGLDLFATFLPWDEVSLTVRYLYANARITSASVASGLEGKRVAQAPKHKASIVGQIHKGRFSGEGHIIYVGKQFDDDQNTRVLDDFVAVHLNVQYEIRHGISLFATVENLFDTQIQSAISGSGILTLGQPRLWSFGASVSF